MDNMTETPWEKLTNFLQDEGYNVVSPNQNDEIHSLTLVTMLGDSAPHPTFSTNVQMYYIYVNVPSGKYSILEREVTKLIEVMKKVRTQFKYVNVFPSYEDPSIKASVVQLIYKAYKKQ